MSVYCDYEYSNDFPSRRRERSPLRRRIPGRIRFATKMLPVSSWTKGRNDFKTMVLPASSQVVSPSQKMFVGQYKYLNILCPKRPKHVKNLYPFSYRHLVTQSQKTEIFHVYLTFDLALDSIGSHKI